MRNKSKFTFVAARLSADCLYGDCLYEVTHWMELPEVPK